MTTPMTSPAQESPAATPFTEDCLSHAALPWEAQRSPVPQSPPFLFFRNPFLEQLFQSPPWMPYLTMGPFVVYGLWRSTACFAHLGTRTTFVYMLGGWLLWSLTEYTMHRFAFHLTRNTPTRQVIGLIIHGHHHLHPHDPRRLVATPFMHGSLAALFFGIYSLFASHALWPLWTGTLCGYLFYEAVHWYAHHGKPRSRWGKALVRHHLRHHYQDDNAFFGISSPLWDYIFRTHRPHTSTTSPTPPNQQADPVEEAKD